MSRTKDVLFAKECIRDLEPAKLPMHTVPWGCRRREMWPMYEDGHSPSSSVEALTPSGYIHPTIHLHGVVLNHTQGQTDFLHCMIYIMACHLLETAT